MILICDNPTTRESRGRWQWIWTYWKYRNEKCFATWKSNVASRGYNTVVYFLFTSESKKCRWTRNTIARQQKIRAKDNSFNLESNWSKGWRKSAWPISEFRTTAPTNPGLLRQSTSKWYYKTLSIEEIIRASGQQSAESYLNNKQGRSLSITHRVESR